MSVSVCKCMCGCPHGSEMACPAVGHGPAERWEPTALEEQQVLKPLPCLSLLLFVAVTKQQSQKQLKEDSVYFRSWSQRVSPLCQGGVAAVSRRYDLEAKASHLTTAENGLEWDKAPARLCLCPETFPNAANNWGQCSDA